MHIFTEIIVYLLAVLWQPRSYYEDNTNALKGNSQTERNNLLWSIYLGSSMLLVPLGVLLFGSDLPTTAPRVANYLLYLLLLALNKGWVWVYYTDDETYARATAVGLVACIGILSAAITLIIYLYELGVISLVLAFLYTGVSVYLTHATTSRPSTSTASNTPLPQVMQRPKHTGGMSMRTRPPLSSQKQQQPQPKSKRQIVINI